MAAQHPTMIAVRPGAGGLPCQSRTWPIPWPTLRTPSEPPRLA